MKFKDEELEAAFMNILDAFSGADGGNKFIHVRLFLGQLDSTEHASGEIAKIVKQFSKLIDCCSKRGG